jgi:Putative DNA-binding domain
VTLLRTIQKEFSLSLLDRDREVPASIRAGARSSRRFDVYRNKVFVSLTDALAARFPVSVSLVGEEFFRAVARSFIELCPPRSPLLMEYGDDFGDFTDTFPPARSLPYLGDVARLEAARTRAYHAADAEPLSADELASLPPCAWEETRVSLHPSVQIVRSRYSVVSIWEAHREDGAPSDLHASSPEDALVVRPGLGVEIHRLPPGGAVFLSKLLERATFREAARKAGASDRDFDLVTGLAALLVGRVIVGLSATQRSCVRPV